MSDNPIPPHEVARLRLEQARAYQERWKTHVDPILSLAETSRGMAHDYAKMALQTMFFLNGGALIAFPAFAQLLGKSFWLAPRLATYSMAAFVVGLAAIATSTYLAYLAMDKDAESIRHWWEKVRSEISLEADPTSSLADWKTLAGSSQKRMLRASHWFRRLSLAASVLGVASMFAFVAGAIFAMDLVSAIHP